MTANIGHNSQLAYDADKLDASKASAQVHLDHAEKWRKAEIADAEQAGRAVDFITGARAARTAIDNERMAQREPLNNALKAIQDAYKPTLDALKSAMDDVKAKVDAWNKAEAQRQREKAQAAAEAARIEREKAEAAAANAEMTGDLLGAAEAQQQAERAADQEQRAAKAKPAQVRSFSGAGRTMATRTFRRAEIVQIGAVFMRYKDDPRVAELLVKLANEEIRAAKGNPLTIPGIKIVTEEKTV